MRATPPSCRVEKKTRRLAVIVGLQQRQMAHLVIESEEDGLPAAVAAGTAREDGGCNTTATTRRRQHQEPPAVAQLCVTYQSRLAVS